MTEINTKKINDNLLRQLKERAALHGCSIESELDSILKSVFDEEKQKSSLKEILLNMPDVGEDADFSRISDNSRDIIL